MQVGRVQNTSVSFQGGSLSIAQKVYKKANKRQALNFRFMRDALHDTGLLNGDKVLYLPGPKDTTKVVIQRAKDSKLFGVDLSGMLDHNYPDENMREFVDLIFAKPLKGMSKLLIRGRIAATKFVNM